MRRISTIIILMAQALLGIAQSSVDAKIDPIEMLIGEQATVTLTVQGQEGAKIEWPQLKPRQLLVPGVEVLHTQRTADNSFVITLTSFDGNLYHLPLRHLRVAPALWRCGDAKIFER